MSIFEFGRCLSDGRVASCARGHYKRPVYAAVIPLFYITVMLLLSGCGDGDSKVTFIERTYKLDDIAVTYNAQGGVIRTTVGGVEIDVETLEDSIPYGKKITLRTPSRPGYDFLGWYSEPNGGGTLYGRRGDVYEMGAKEIVMHAHWEYALRMDFGDSLINGIVCVRVAPGTFTMGSPLDEVGRTYDETQRSVTLTEEFWISKYPITKRQYARSFPDTSFVTGDHPVTDVTWFDAEDFTKAMSVNGWTCRLPTEAQWEFAARGGSFGLGDGYVYSGGNTLDDVAWYNSLEGIILNGTRAVGEKRPNQLGIYDMSGNVSEWCRDWYGIYDMTDLTDPERTTPNAEGRVRRGGGWNSPARDCRVADRAYAPPLEKSGDLGFRVVFFSSTY